MTDFTRSSTLSLRRRPAPALTSRPKTTVERAEESTAKPGVRSETLLQGRSHISIVHNGETYQLRATRLGKLILTK